MLLLVVRLFPLISRDCLSNLCMLRAGICFVAVSSLLCLYYLGAWPLTYMICSAPKKKVIFGFCENICSYIPHFLSDAPCSDASVSASGAATASPPMDPLRIVFFWGWVIAYVFFTLEPFNAGHPCTEAWFSMKTCISVTCSYFWYFFLCFSFFVPVCIWFPVYSTESLFLALCHFFLFLSLTK